MSRKVCILDYGSGNVTSVYNALKRLSIACLISNDPKDIISASHLILPGVGAFRGAMDKIHARLPVETLVSQVVDGKPVLGICVGMQVFAEFGHEFEFTSGLNLINGAHVIKMPERAVLPHIGWNDISIKISHPIFDHIDTGTDFYFVHSYIMSEISNEIIAATSDYEGRFPAVVIQQNLIGVQFHPEKSQRGGERLFENFWKLN
jgi:glutamine amidotransferase